MDLLLILNYAAICYGVFKLFKIPVNACTLLTAALGGVLLLAKWIWLLGYDCAAGDDLFGRKLPP